MGWFSKSSSPDFQLLNKRTAGGGVVFWVRDARKANDRSFIDALITSSMDNFPEDFVRQMSLASDDDLLLKTVHPLPKGECELHLEFSSKPPEMRGYFRDAEQTAQALCDLVSRELPEVPAQGAKQKFAGSAAGKTHSLTRG